MLWPALVIIVIILILVLVAIASRAKSVEHDLRRRTLAIAAAASAIPLAACAGPQIVAIVAILSWALVVLTAFVVAVRTPWTERSSASPPDGHVDRTLSETPVAPAGAAAARQDST